MKIYIPILKQEIKEGQIHSSEVTVPFEIDTSVYSEERWEQNFPALAAHEGLFEYIGRIQENSLTARVKVASMLKAIYCLIECAETPTYKDFAQMFNLAVPEYTERLISTLKDAFSLILNGSTTKN